MVLIGIGNKIHCIFFFAVFLWIAVVCITKLWIGS